MKLQAQTSSSAVEMCVLSPVELWWVTVIALCVSQCTSSVFQHHDTVLLIWKQWFEALFDFCPPPALLAGVTLCLLTCLWCWFLHCVVCMFRECDITVWQYESNTSLVFFWLNIECLVVSPYIRAWPILDFWGRCRYQNWGSIYRLIISVNRYIAQALHQKSLSYLIHPRGSEEDPHLFGILLQFPVLLMAELQITLVFTVGFPPGLFRSVRALQGPLVKFVLQFTLLEFGTISTTVLWRWIQKIGSLEIIE